MAEMLHTIRGWRSQRKKLAEDAGQLLRDAGDDPLGAEAEERFEAIHGEIDALTARIERSERQHDLEASLARSAGPQIGLRDWGAPGDGADAENRHETRGGARTETREATPWPENRSHDEEASFRYICQGSTSLDIPGHSEAFELRTVGDAEIYDQMRREVRSINSGNAEAGGYLIAPRYFGQLLKGMETFGGLRESRARDWRTGHGSAVNIATNNDTQMADVVGYGQTVAEKPTAYGNLTSNTLLANSGVFPVDLDVLEDATETANLQADLWDIAGRRIERRIQFEATTNDPAVSGRGNAGLLTAAPKGHDAALVDAVTFDEMWILKHSVNRAHRHRGEWGFSDSTELALKRMKNTHGDPAWSPGAVQFGAPKTFDGDPYHVNDYLPGMEADAKSILYGDFSRLRLRIVRRVTLFRFAELFMREHQIGFMAFVRFGHLLEDPGDAPIKYLQHPPA